MGDRRRLRAQRRGTWARHRRRRVSRLVSAYFWLAQGYIKRDFEGIRVVAGAGPKSARLLFAVRDDDDGRVRVDGPDIQRGFAPENLAGAGGRGSPTTGLYWSCNTIQVETIARGRRGQ